MLVDHSTRDYSRRLGQHWLIQVSAITKNILQSGCIELKQQYKATQYHHVFPHVTLSMGFRASSKVDSNMTLGANTLSYSRPPGRPRCPVAMTLFNPKPVVPTTRWIIPV